MVVPASGWQEISLEPTEIRQTILQYRVDSKRLPQFGARKGWSWKTE
jgi:hypothetical protein